MRNFGHLGDWKLHFLSSRCFSAVYGNLRQWISVNVTLLASGKIVTIIEASQVTKPLQHDTFLQSNLGLHDVMLGWSHITMRRVAFRDFKLGLHHPMLSQVTQLGKTVVFVCDYSWLNGSHPEPLPERPPTFSSSEIKLEMHMSSVQRCHTGRSSWNRTRRPGMRLSWRKKEPTVITLHS